MFDRLVWKPDRMLLGDLVFRLQHFRSDDWDLGDECFVFYKVKELVDQYAEFFAGRPGFRPGRVFELGMFDGGSVAFWAELFGPQKHVAIDIGRRRDTPFFERYKAARGLGDRVRTYWDTDQADAARLAEICRAEFDGPLDLVIDDASHLYRPTRVSFETLFPRVRPGGLYVIEDWAWGHWPSCIGPGGFPPTEVPLTRLVFDLVELAGTSRDWVRRVDVFQGFAVVERGEATASAGGGFRLDDHVTRRPRTSLAGRALYAGKRFARRVGGRVRRQLLGAGR